MKAFIKNLFRPENLRPKKINGRELRGRDFAESVDHYVKELRSGNYPEIGRLLDCTIRAANSVLINECVGKFEVAMLAIIENNPGTPGDFESSYDNARNVALDHFKQSKKMGSDDDVETFLADLRDRIANLKEYFEGLNSTAYHRITSGSARLARLLPHLLPLLLASPPSQSLGMVVGASLGSPGGPIGSGLGAAVGWVVVTTLLYSRSFLDSLGFRLARQ